MRDLFNVMETIILTPSCNFTEYEKWKRSNFIFIDLNLSLLFYQKKLLKSSNFIHSILDFRHK